MFFSLERVGDAFCENHQLEIRAVETKFLLWKNARELSHGQDPKQNSAKSQVAIRALTTRTPRWVGNYIRLRINFLDYRKRWCRPAIAPQGHFCGLASWRTARRAAGLL
jgi:hypothetical protein